ncbi:hypothetical protein Tco_0870617 [Tanacetum coccineum]
MEQKRRPCNRHWWTHETAKGLAWMKKARFFFIRVSGLSGDGKTTVSAVVERKLGTGGFGRVFFVARRVCGGTDRISGHCATETQGMRVSMIPLTSITSALRHIVHEEGFKGLLRLPPAFLEQIFANAISWFRRVLELARLSSRIRRTALSS